MNRIFKLFIDENIKTWKKLSTKLAIILIILSLIGVLGFVKIMQKSSENIEIARDEFYWKEYVETNIETLKKSLSDENLDSQSRKKLQMELKKYEWCIKYNINPHANTWKSEILEQMQEDANIVKLEQILQTNDFNEYIKTKKENVKQEFDNKQISKQEYDDKIMILNLKLKHEIGKEESNEYWKAHIVDQIEQLQGSIRKALDYKTNKVLTVEQKEEYEDQIKINIYRIENDLPPIEYVNENYRMIFETLAPMLVTSAIAVFAIIIAGGAISSEISRGTIKFWALTPNKRWKILTAKILSILFYIIIITLIMSLLTVVCSNVFFANKGNEYLYVKDGVVKKIENTRFIIEYYFAKSIPVIIFAIFALMLSTITRNTSVSVSLSVAIYMGNTIVMTIINQLVEKDWIKFVPFNNLNVVDKIFPNFENPVSILLNSSATSTSLEFSLGVLAVCVILMLVTTYDSFNNRDII